MMRQKVISLLPFLALVLPKFHCASRHDTACKYWDSPSSVHATQAVHRPYQFLLRVNIKIEGVLYPENAREKNDAVSS